ncbi:MAG: nodulation protein NfeD [Anaerolineae bacterium]|nr:nodulation protein NfeD [Anaerolineae bacterium]
MRTIFRVTALGLLVLAFALPMVARAQGSAHVNVLTVTGAIDTWVEGYINRGISLSEQDGAQAVIILLNTPGGALNATQNITTRILNARVPVIVFVYPQGAWAGSAGTFITIAAHIAAMAPTTTIGAAHPVSSGGHSLEGDERDKIVNFSAAIIQNLEKQRGRHTEWVAKAVRESASATAQEALELNVIDLIANDPNDLLNKIDGKTIKTVAGELTLKTQRAGLVYVDMNIAELILHTMVDPNIALILLQLGLLALVVELYNPGATFPAVFGAICLVLAFVALGNLPVNWGGVILIVMAVIAFIIDVNVNSIALTIGALVMFVLGALMLFTPFTPQPPTMPTVSVSPWVVLVTGGAMLAFFVFIIGAAVRGYRYPVISGSEALVGVTGVAVTDLAPSGIARVKSEEWMADAIEGEIRQGEAIKVVRVDGLRLKVVKK